MKRESPPSSPTIYRASYVRRRIEQIAMFTQDPNALEILASGSVNPLRAIVLRAVMATPGLPNFLYQQTVAPEYRKAGFDIIGVGYGAVTVSDGPDMVRKFYRHTAGNSEEAHKAAIELWTAKQSLTLEHLGAYAVPQFFSIEENPTNTSESIVSAIQRRINPRGAINMFQSEQIPELAIPFLHDSQAMHQNSIHNAVPDLVGRDNVLIESGTSKVFLIDPIALLGDDQGDKSSHAKVARYLDDFKR